MRPHRFQKDAVSYFPGLPTGWREERIHDVAELRTSNVDKKSEDGENPVKLCNYVDVYKNDRITSDLEFMDATATVAQIERFSLHVGDVVVTKDSETPDDIGVPAFVAESFPKLVCGYHLTILRPEQTLVLGGYLFYAVASRLSAYQFYLAANGVTRFGLTYQGTKNVRIAFPSVPEQQQIAAFLDWKTRQIDALIARKKELLEKLKEKRLAVITQAVTKGLNPIAPMRDSGIPWLGQVPRHWEFAELRRFTVFITSGSRGWAEYYSDEGAIFVRIGNLTRHSINVDLSELQYVDPPPGAEGERTRIRQGDILFSITAYLGSVAVATEPIIGAYINQHIALVRVAQNRMDPRFVAYSVLGDVGQLQLSGLGYGGTKIQLSLDDVKSLWLCVPSLQEQTAIAAYLDVETAKLDTLVAKVELAIDRLSEYRTALITAATTGKIDVRGVKIPQSAA